MGLGLLLFVPVINLILQLFGAGKSERRGYPGALSLFKAGYIIPPIFPLVFIIDIVITGIVAWERKMILFQTF